MQIASTLDAGWPEVAGAISEATDLEATALEATARSCGALVRRREIRTAEHPHGRAVAAAGAGWPAARVACGPGSLPLCPAAAWAEIAAGTKLSDTAVMKRIRDVAGRPAGRDRRRALVSRADDALPLPPAGPLSDRRLRIVDGSVVTRPGSTGADWRLHAVYEPAASPASN